MNYEIYAPNEFAVHATEGGVTIVKTRKCTFVTDKPVKVIHKEDLSLEGKDSLKGAEMPCKPKIAILEEMI